MEDQPRFPAEDHEEDYAVAEEIISPELSVDSEEEMLQGPPSFENIKQQMGNLFPRILSEQDPDKNPKSSKEQSYYSKKAAESMPGRDIPRPQEIIDSSKNSNEEVVFTEAIFDKRHEIKLPQDKEASGFRGKTYSGQLTPISEVIAKKSHNNRKPQAKKQGVFKKFIVGKTKRLFNPIIMGIILAILAFLIILIIV